MATDLDGQIARLEAVLRDKRTQARKLGRRDHARRLIVYGAAVLRLLDGLPEDRRAALLRRLHTEITRPGDRLFLGLLPGAAGGGRWAPDSRRKP